MFDELRAGLAEWWRTRNDPPPFIRDTVTKEIHTYAAPHSVRRTIREHRDYGWDLESDVTSPYTGRRTLTFRRYDGELGHTTTRRGR